MFVKDKIGKYKTEVDLLEQAWHFLWGQPEIYMNNIWASITWSDYLEFSLSL